MNTSAQHLKQFNNYFSFSYLSVVFRGDCCCDFCHPIRIGSDGQIHMQQERNISEPGSKSSSTWRQQRVPLQRPAGFSERSQWKPEGVFYLAGLLNNRSLTWPCTDQEDLLSVLYKIPLSFFLCYLFFFVNIVHFARKTGKCVGLHSPGSNQWCQFDVHNI